MTLELLTGKRDMVNVGWSFDVAFPDRRDRYAWTDVTVLVNSNPKASLVPYVEAVDRKIYLAEWHVWLPFPLNDNSLPMDECFRPRHATVVVHCASSPSLSVTLVFRCRVAVLAYQPRYFQPIFFRDKLSSRQRAEAP